MPRKREDNKGRASQHQEESYWDEEFESRRGKLPSPPRPIIDIDFSSLPGFVWFFILAVAGLWGGWFVYVANLVPAYSFPVEALLWTVGTVFFLLGLWKLPVWWGLKFWLLTAALMGATAIVWYYIPHFDLKTVLLAIGFGGGMLGLMALMVQYLEP